MSIGFLIIDMQAVHLNNQVEQQKIDHACEYINYVADLIRSSNHLIVHIRDIEGRQEANQKEYDIIPEIHVKDTDLQVTKEYSNAFWQTELEQILLDNAVELVIIAGMAAEHCVLFTYNGAVERGFKPVLLQNGILSTHSDVIASTYRDRNLISYPVIKYLIGK